jgi:murein L,D-transpeptidase YafK
MSLSPAALLVLFVLPSSSDNFAAEQNRAPRVIAARAAKATRVAELFAKAGVAYPARELYLRAFKLEGELEVWAGDRHAPLRLVATYPICARSGELGPKRAMGDMQVPEGFYRLAQWNPASNFHLSLGIDYPNDADRRLGRKGALGGDIFIHGSCVTIGCIPIQDGPIEELYLMALDARLAARTEIAVHLFPRRLNEAGVAALRALAANDPPLAAFWLSLVPAYRQFEAARHVPHVRVDARSGAYQVSPL